MNDESIPLRCYAMKVATSEGKTAKSALKLGTAGGRAFGVPASAKQPWQPSVMTARVDEGVLCERTLRRAAADPGMIIPPKRSSRPAPGESEKTLVGVWAGAMSSPWQVSTWQLSALGFLLLKVVERGRGGVRLPDAPVYSAESQGLSARSLPWLMENESKEMPSWVLWLDSASSSSSSVSSAECSGEESLGTVFCCTEHVGDAECETTIGAGTVFCFFLAAFVSLATLILSLLVSSSL